MRRFMTVVPSILLLAPGLAWAADGTDALSVSSLVIGAGSIMVSVLLALLAWSLKNNVEGFKIAMQQALAEAKRAMDRAENAEKDVGNIRVEMASSVTREDVKALTLAIAQIQREVGTLTTEVAVLNRTKQEQSHAPGH